jgi:hypothetical protein
MTDHTTAATARKLKEAGFQQPVPQEDQVWYSGRNQSKTTLRQSENYRGMLIADTYIIGGKFSEIADFAPSATDILRELGPGFYLESKGDHWACGYYYPDKEITPKVSQNPAEACAAAWLDKKGK